MYDSGLASTIRGPPMPRRPSRTWARDLCDLKPPPTREASSSRTIWPTLCRLWLYSGPGLPRPTISQVSVMVQSFGRPRSGRWAKSGRGGAAPETTAAGPQRDPATQNSRELLGSDRGTFGGVGRGLFLGDLGGLG